MEDQMENEMETRLIWGWILRPSHVLSMSSIAQVGLRVCSLVKIQGFRGSKIHESKPVESSKSRGMKCPEGSGALISEWSLCLNFTCTRFYCVAVKEPKVSYHNMGILYSKYLIGVSYHSNLS